MLIASPNVCQVAYSATRYMQWVESNLYRLICTQSYYFDRT
jgi:hypothetical protein